MIKIKQLVLSFIFCLFQLFYYYCIMEDELIELLFFGFIRESLTTTAISSTTSNSNTDQTETETETDIHLIPSDLVRICTNFYITSDYFDWQSCSHVINFLSSTNAKDLATFTRHIHGRIKQNSPYLRQLCTPGSGQRHLRMDIVYNRRGRGYWGTCFGTVRCEPGGIYEWTFTILQAKSDMRMGLQSHHITSTNASFIIQNNTKKRKKE